MLPSFGQLFSVLKLSSNVAQTERPGKNTTRDTTVLLGRLVAVESKCVKDLKRLACHDGRSRCRSPGSGGWMQRLLFVSEVTTRVLWIGPSFLYESTHWHGEDA